MKWGDTDLYCRDLVKRVAHDAYVVSLFAPREKRSAIWAIHAFNYEIAKIRETVSEPMLGEIRIKWWLDTIEEIYHGKARHHQVVQGLVDACKRFDLEKLEFQTLIKGRMTDLTNEPFRKIEDLCTYIDQTVTPLNRLILGVLTQTEAKNYDRPISAASIGYGISGLLRAAPYFFRQNRNFIPADLMSEVGLTERNLFSLRPSVELSKAIARLGKIALLRLDEVLSVKISRNAYPAVLSAAQARWYLRRLDTFDYNPYVREISLPLPFHEVRLALKVLRRRWQ